MLRRLLTKVIEQRSFRTALETVILLAARLLAGSVTVFDGFALMATVSTLPENEGNACDRFRACEMLAGHPVSFHLFWARYTVYF